MILEQRVRFELTVFGICNPMRWATPPPLHSMVSDARIELALLGPKPRVIPFHQSELTWCPMTESNCHPLITKQVFYHLTNRAILFQYQITWIWIIIPIKVVFVCHTDWHDISTDNDSIFTLSWSREVCCPSRKHN